MSMTMIIYKRRTIDSFLATTSNMFRRRTNLRLVLFITKIIVIGPFRLRVVLNTKSERIGLLLGNVKKFTSLAILTTARGEAKLYIIPAKASFYSGHD